MRENMKSDNKKALPKFFLLIVVSGAFGAALGFGAGAAGAAGLPERVTVFLNAFWRAVTPWAIPAATAVLLGAALLQYRGAKRAFAAWDGEDEETIGAADRRLNWALLWTSLTMVLDFFFMGAGLLYHRGGMAGLAVTGWFILSMILTTLMQQKVVDLTKRMNPEKQGSVYDLRFQKKWLESCDEAEQRQIGQAAMKAFRVTSSLCAAAWVALIVLGFVFDLGLMPVFLLTVIWAVLQTTYILECIRLEKGKP